MNSSARLNLDAEHGVHLSESGLQLQAGTGSFSSSPSNSIDILPHMTYCILWGHSKQDWITCLHCTCRGINASSWSGKSTCWEGHACQSALYGGGQTLGGRSRYREYVKIRSILIEHGATTVGHRLPSCGHCWSFYTGYDPARGVPCQERHNPHIGYLDTCTKNRHTTQEDLGHKSEGNVQARLRKPVCNAWNCHLHWECCNTHYWCRDIV